MGEDDLSTSPHVQPHGPPPDPPPSAPYGSAEATPPAGSPAPPERPADDQTQPYGSERGMPPPSAPFGVVGPTRPLGHPRELDPTPSVGDQVGPRSAPGPGATNRSAALPPAASAEQRDRARRVGRVAIVNALMAFVLTILLFPFGALGAAGFSVAAVVVGIRARRAAVLARTSEAAGVVAVVLGSIGISMVIVIGTSYVLLWDELRTYRDCTSGANTLAGEQICQAQFEDAIRGRFGIPAR